MEEFKKTFSFQKEFFVRFAVAAALAFAFVACGDNGGGNTAPVIGVGVVGACTGCEEINQYPMQIATVTSSNVQRTFQLGLQLTGGGPRYMSQATPVNTPGNMYVGPIAATGQFIANTSLVDFSGRCQIPPGTYRVDSVTAGIMGQPVRGNLELPALILSPGNIQVQITQGILHQQATKLMGIIRIISVNGMPCDPRFRDNLY